MAKRAAAELRDLSSRPHILVPESSDAHVRGQPNTTPVSSRLQVPSAVPARGPSPGSRGRGPSPLRRPRPRVLTPLLGLARVYTNFPAPQSNDPHGCSPRPANLQTGFVPERGEVPTASWDQERSAARGGVGRGAGLAQESPGPASALPGPAPAPPQDREEAPPTPAARRPRRREERALVTGRPLCSPLSGSACGRPSGTRAVVWDMPAWGLFCSLCGFALQAASPSSPAPRPGGDHFFHSALALPSQKPGPRGRTSPGF